MEEPENHFPLEGHCHEMSVTDGYPDRLMFSKVNHQWEIVRRLSPLSHLVMPCLSAPKNVETQPASTRPSPRPASEWQEQVRRTFDAAEERRLRRLKELGYLQSLGYRKEVGEATRQDLLPLSLSKSKCQGHLWLMVHCEPHFQM